MVKFYIQSDSDIPASAQLYNQIRFAIASRQYPPGHKLPSTRQLAQITGLHRNTISKVYSMLEDSGLVEAQAGSGIYVRPLGDEGSGENKHTSPLQQEYPQAYKLVRQCLDDLLKQGCSLKEARELFLAEVDWRLRCSARVLVTAPTQDIGAGELMTRELEQALQTPVQLVPMEELAQVLDQTRSGTVVTSRYFIGDAEAIAAPKSVRVIPLDLYDYAQEMKLIGDLAAGSCLGIVSLSPGILRAADVIIHSLRGDDLLITTAQPDDTYKLNAVIRSAQTVISDPASFQTVKAAVALAREDLIRPPRVVCCENYVSDKSIKLLKRELGLD